MLANTGQPVGRSEAEHNGPEVDVLGVEQVGSGPYTVYDGLPAASHVPMWLVVGSIVGLLLCGFALALPAAMALGERDKGAAWEARDRYEVGQHARSWVGGDAAWIEGEWRPAQPASGPSF